jgi:hypothetical protein
VEWIWYLDAQREARQVKRAFTDLAKPDDFLRHAARRCVFHMRDLVALVDIVERLRARGSARKIHKLTPEVLVHSEHLRRKRTNLRTRDLVAELQRTFGLTIHRRSLERLLAGKKIPELSAVVCREDAIGYEKLLSCALSGTLAHGVSNFGALMQRGLAAWLTTAPPSEPRQPAANTPNSTPLPDHPKSDQGGQLCMNRALLPTICRAMPISTFECSRAP